MDIKAVTFSLVALIGAGSLLWIGYGGGQHEHDGEDDEHEAHEEVAAGSYPERAGVMTRVEFKEHGDADYDSGDQEQARSLRQSGDILSLEQILQRAGKLRGGRVLDTELEREDGRYIYEVELVDDRGQVWELKFDGRSGEMLREERED